MNREYQWKMKETKWDYTFPQIKRFLEARKRYVDEQNNQSSEQPGSYNEAESILKEANAQRPMTMDEVKKMLVEFE